MAEICFWWKRTVQGRYGCHFHSVTTGICNDLFASVPHPQVGARSCMAHGLFIISFHALMKSLFIRKDLSLTLRSMPTTPPPPPPHSLTDHFTPDPPVPLLIITARVRSTTEGNVFGLFTARGEGGTSPVTGPVQRPARGRGGIPLGQNR